MRGIEERMQISTLTTPETVRENECLLFPAVKLGGILLHSLSVTNTAISCSLASMVGTVIMIQLALEQFRG